MSESKHGVAINMKNARKSRNFKLSENLSEDALKSLLAEASKDDKAEALKRLLGDLKPVLLELMKNKAWSSRKTAQFLKSRKILVRACDVESFLKANPFDASDSEALLKLRRNSSKTETKEPVSNERRI